MEAGTATRMLAPIDFAILGAFLAFSIASGLRARKVSSKNLEEYFLAGRTIPGWKAGISMAATQFAADTPLLVTGLIATAGVFSLWRLWIYALAFLFMGFVLAGAWRRAGVLTDAELAELRYDSRLATTLRAAKAIYFGTIFNCTVMAMVLFAATRVAEPFLLWNEWLPAGLFEHVRWLVGSSGLVMAGAGDPALLVERSANNVLSLLLVVSVTALYSTTGGLRAVVNTDLVQFAIAMLATLAYAVAVVREAGGLAELPVRLTALYGSDWAMATLAITPSHARDASALVIGTIAIQWFAQMNADGTGYLAQRTMACRSDRDARQAAVVFAVAQVLLRSLFWLPIGVGLLILFPLAPGSAPEGLAATREATFVEGVATLLPAGALGLMLTGMLAALASTIDTHLNWGASYWTNDIYRRLVCQAWLGREPSGRSLVWVARLSNLLVLAVAAVVLTRLDSIQTAWKTSLLLGAGMGPPLVLRWLWWRVTAEAELASIAVSALLAPILLATVEPDGARVLIVTVATTAVAIVVSLLGPSTPGPRVLEFYRRVRPPGFWGPVATACGEPGDAAVARLGHGLSVTLRSALAIFCVLVGIGSWLIGSPPPAWFPWQGPWIAAMLLAGVSLGFTLRSQW
jgi:SSS family solute:Na+ symporter